MVKDFFCFLLGILGIIFLGFWMIMLFGWVIAGYEYKAWNQLHGTNYTQMQWFSGSDFIQKYHYPDRAEANKNEININSN